MFRNLLVAVAALVLLGGCANSRIANQDALAAAAVRAAAQTDLSLDDAIGQAGMAITAASNEGLGFYAPLHLERARAALEEAKKLRSKDRKGEKEALALAEALKAEQLVAAARRTREKVEQVLAAALEHRRVLVELGTDKVLPKEFDKGMSLLTDAIKEVEGDNVEKARNAQASAIAWFNQIEGDTLRVQFLNRARALLDKAADADADDYAPASWETAEKTFARADEFIETNFRDREGVKAITAQAYNHASRAYHIATEVQKVVGKNPDDIEQYMLGIQQLFDGINQYAGVMDLDALSFAEQSRQLAAAVRDGGVPASVSGDPTETALAAPAPQSAQEEAGNDAEAAPSAEAPPVDQGVEPVEENLALVDEPAAEPGSVPQEVVAVEAADDAND